MNFFDVFFALWIVTVAGVAYYLFFEDIICAFLDDILSIAAATKIFGWRLNRYDKK